MSVSKISPPSSVQTIVKYVYKIIVILYYNIQNMFGVELTPRMKLGSSIVDINKGVTLNEFGEVSITELSILKESTPVVIVPTALRTGEIRYQQFA